MSWFLRVGLGAAICSVWFTEAVGEEPSVRSKVKVELRWVETRRVEGLTEDVGFQSSCDPDSIVYPHRKPALVLTSAEVTEARISQHDFATFGTQYMVALHLTEDARQKLSQSCQGDQMRLLTVVVDDKCWGLRRYEKGQAEFVPVQAKAETFLPEVGYFSSRRDAERLVKAFD